MKKYRNRVNGIMLMACSVVLTFFLMLMIDWNPMLGLMHNLSSGVSITIEDFHGQCGPYVTRLCGDLLIYFKYAAIVPLTSFLFGLYWFLNSKYQYDVSSENA